MDKPQIRLIPIKKLKISLFNIRHSNLEEGIDELAKSIATIGLLHPIVVRSWEEGYEVVMGQRRFLAFRKLYQETEDPKWEKIPAIVSDVKDETEILIRSLSENVQRLDLTYDDKMEVAVKLRDKLGSDEEAAKRIGVTVKTFKKWLGYKAVPEPIKRMVNEGKLSATTAMRISQSIPEEDRAVEVAEKVRELDRGEKRNLFIDLARDKPKEKIEEVAKEAQELRFSKVTVHFTKRVFEALIQAENENKTSKEQIVREAAEEWLEEEGFME